jgi:hypothetical protein
MIKRTLRQKWEKLSTYSSQTKDSNDSSKMLLTIRKALGWVWQFMPIIPALSEAEAEGLWVQLQLGLHNKILSHKN